MISSAKQVMLNTSFPSGVQSSHILHEKNQFVYSLVDAGAMKTIEPTGGVANGTKMFQFFVTKVNLATTFSADTGIAKLKVPY